MEDTMTKHVDRKINEGAERLQDGIDKARKTAVSAVDRALPLVEDVIEKAKLKGEAAWENAKEKGQDLIDDVESAGLKSWKQARTFVKSRPLQTVACALALGAVLGALFLTRSRD